MNLEKMLDWLEGRLEPAQADAVAKLADSDPEAAATAEWLCNFMTVTADFTLADPPLNLRPALQKLFDSERDPGPVQRVLAWLASDSWSGTPAPGMRHAGIIGETRQLLFSSDLLDVSTTLRPHADGDSFDIQGQVLPLAGIDPGACHIELNSSESTSSMLTESDPSGNFEFRDLPNGEYSMAISGPGFEINMPMLKWR